MEVLQNSPVVPQQPFLGDELRLLDRYEMQSDLVTALSSTKKHRHLVPKVARCHRVFRHWRCEHNDNWAEAEGSCCQRVCPHCSRRRSLILAGRIENFVIGKTDLRYAVLAEANCTDLKAGIASLWASWTRLRRSVRWLRRVQGAIVALEVTRNRKDGTWHPHLNVLIEGEYFPFEELNKLWVKATKGKGHTSFIRAADAGTVRELIKYVTKLSDILDDSTALDEFLTAVDRLRLVRTYGTFYALPVDDEENPGTCCPDCTRRGLSNVSVVRLGYVQPHQVSLDFDGVLRVNRSARAVADDLREATAFPPVLPVARVVYDSADRRWREMQKRFAANFLGREN